MTGLGKSLTRTWAPYFGMDATFKSITDHHSSLVYHLFLIDSMFLSANHVLIKSLLRLLPITKDSPLFHTFTSHKSNPAPKLSPTFSSFYSTPPLIALLATSDNFLSGKDCGLGAQRQSLTWPWSCVSFQSTDNSCVSHSRRVKITFSQKPHTRRRQGYFRGS